MVMDLRKEIIADLFFEQVKALTLKDYMNWKDYKEKIDFLDTLWFQQRTRRENIANMT